MNLIIVDDHAIFADLIGEYLKSNGFDIISIYNNGNDLRSSDLLSMTDLFLLDLGLPDSSETENIKFIKENYPDKKIVVFTSNVNQDLLVEIYQMGVEGYLPKTKEKTKILEVLHKVLNGSRHFEKIGITDILSHQKQSYVDVALTKRELEVLKHLSNSYTTNDISDKMHLSINTIKTYKKNLNKKFDVNSTEELVLKARRKGII